MKRLYIALSVVASLSSCTTMMQTASTMDATASLNTAAVADLEVSSQRVTHTMTPSKAVQRGGLANVKRVAEAEALEKSGGGDLLVNPEYTICQRRGLFSSKVTSITVSGRPANYKNVRNLPDSVWCNPVFRGVAGRRSGVLATSPVPPAPEPKGKAKASSTPVKKLTCVVRVGLGANDLVKGYYENTDAHFGYSLGVEFNRAMGRKGAYWGMDLSLASRGYNYENGEYDVHRRSEGCLYHGIYWSPFIFGWKIAIPHTDFSIDPHIGAFFGGDYSSEADVRFDGGLNFGVGVWYKNKYSLDFLVHRGFVDSHDSHYEYYGWNGYYPYGVDCAGGGQTRNIMVRFGIAF